MDSDTDLFRIDSVRPGRCPDGACSGRTANAFTSLKEPMDTQTIQRRRWVILGVLVVGLMAIVIDNTVLNVALKTIANPSGGLGASQSELEWAINSYTLVFAGLLFTFGVVGDRVGRKRVLMAGLVLFGIGSLFSAYSHSPDQLIAARAVMGLGGAAVLPQTLSIIANVFEPAERSRAIGIWTSAVGIGVAIGPVLGGVLLSHFWWGSVFLINVPVTVAGAIVTFILVPDSRNPAPGKIDFIGVLGSILGLVLLVYGIVQGGDGESWLSAGVLGPVIGGIAVLGLFAWYESRIDHPSLDVRLFKNRRLSASVGTIALLFFGMGGVYFFTSFYMQNVRGYSPLAAGALAVPFAVAQFLSAPRSAALVARFGPRAVGIAGTVLNAVAIGGWAFLGKDSPVWIILVLFFIQGIGLGLAVPAATASVMESLPRERAGAGSALTNTARQVAVALSVAVLGSILSSAYRSALNPTLSALPAGARNAAGTSITATQAVAARLGHAGQFLLAPADSAFVDAMRITTAVAAGIAIVGGLAVLRAMPGRTRPNIEELVASEVAAAERELAAEVAVQPELSDL
jgi:EmrB/QacA subfamily drug resistance transporter